MKDGSTAVAGLPAREVHRCVAPLSLRTFSIFVLGREVGLLNPLDQIAPGDHLARTDLRLNHPLGESEFLRQLADQLRGECRVFVRSADQLNLLLKLLQFVQELRCSLIAPLELVQLIVQRQFVLRPDLQSLQHLQLLTDGLALHQVLAVLYRDRLLECEHRLALLGLLLVVDHLELDLSGLLLGFFSASASPAVLAAFSSASRFSSSFFSSSVSRLVVSGYVAVPSGYRRFTLD